MKNNNDNNTTLIDKSGNIINNPKIWIKSINSFHDGYAVVKRNDDFFNWINKDGKLLFPDQWFYFCGRFNKGYAEIRTIDGWNIINKKGKMISDQYFDWVSGISDEKITIKTDGMWHDVKIENGKIIIINSTPVY